MNEIKQLALNGILIATIAHGAIGVSLVWDKVLLQRKGTQSLVSYVFWLGAISIFGVVLVAFGFKMPPLRVAGLGFSAGVLDLIASFFYYWALKSGEASEELAAMGGFGPVATALIAAALLPNATGGKETGFIIMTLGGFFMFFAEKRPLKQMLPKILIASGAFGLMNVVQKMVFNQTNFVSGYVFFTLGTFFGSLALLIPPSWRKQVFAKSESGGEVPKNRFWYFVNRFLAGVGSFLVVFAISRASPALVQAISGVRYAVIFVGAYLITKWKPSWFREDFGTRALVTKAIATGLVIAGLVISAIQNGGTGGGGATP